MSDLISGSQIYNYIKTQINPYGKPFEGTTFEFGTKIMEYIENMTPVEPVRGEWEYQWFDSVCSNCGYINKDDSVTRIRDDHNFCPNCGADMRGEKND